MQNELYNDVNIEYNKRSNMKIEFKLARDHATLAFK